MHRAIDGNLPMLSAGLSSRPFRILSGLCLSLALPGACLAQVDRSALNDTVTDPSGRVLPGVEVVVVQDSTGLRRGR
jgi:hypothetical protein